MSKIRVHYWHVHTRPGAAPLERELESLAARGIEQRLIMCGVQRVRLDEVIPVDQPLNGTRFWRLKFSKFRDDNWPGVSSLGEPAKDLVLGDDEVLSEETLAVYCPQQDRFVIQYNHFGVRASKIKDFLNLAALDPGRYLLAPVLTNEAQAKYEQKRIVTAVDAVIDGVTEADIALMNGTGVEGAIQRSVENQVGRFRFEFSVDARLKTNKIQRTFVERVVDAITNRAGDADTLSVTAKENEEDAVEIINLLESRKMTEYNADQVERTAGRRFDSEQMYGLLTQAMKEWIRG